VKCSPIADQISNEPNQSGPDQFLGPANKNGYIIWFSAMNGWRILFSEKWPLSCWGQQKSRKHCLTPVFWNEATSTAFKSVVIQGKTTRALTGSTDIGSSQSATITHGS